MTFFAKMIEVHAQVHVVVFKESIQEQNLSIYCTKVSHKRTNAQ